jgi:CHAT domain-containing protein/tetratricopeptide (TPR) repeat protein
MLNCFNLQAEVKKSMLEIDKLISKNDYNTALDISLQIRQEIIQSTENNSEDLVSINSKVANIYYELMEFDKAIEYYNFEKDLIENKFSRSETEYIHCLNNLATTYQRIGKYSKSKDLFEQCLNRLDSNNTDENYIMIRYTAFNNLGKVYESTGELQKAEDLYQKSIELKINSNADQFTLANSYINIADLYFKLNNMKLSLKYYKTASEIFNSNPDYKENQFGCLIKLLRIYRQTGDNQNFESIKMTLLKYDKDNIQDFSNIIEYAVYLANEKRYSEALYLLNEYLTKVENSEGKSSYIYISFINLLGIINWLNNDLETAHNYLSMVKAIKELFWKNNTLEIAISTHNLAGIKQYLGNNIEAEKLFKESIDKFLLLTKQYFPFLSDMEKASFYSLVKDRIYLYYNLIFTRYKSNPKLIEDMININLQSKSFILKSLQKLKRNILNSNDPELLDDFNNWQRLRESLLTHINSNPYQNQDYLIQKDSIEDKINNIEKKLSKSVPSFDDEYGTKITDWHDIKNSLKADEAAIEIIKIPVFDKVWKPESNYSAIIITPNSETPQFVNIGNETELEGENFKKYSNLINFKSTNFDSIKIFEKNLKSELSILGYQYWDKIESKITGYKKIYFSPDGIYHFINLSTLVDRENNYLIDKYDINIVTNLKDIISNSNKTVLKESAIVFGPPDFNLSGNKINKWGSLSQEEPKIVTEILSKSISATQLLGVEASEQTLKNINSPSILHIVSHGFFNKDSITNLTNYNPVLENKVTGNPLLYSGIVCAESNFSSNNDLSNDGLLTAYEVVNMNLDNTYLTVLSACVTGLGLNENGEGVYGLQRAFMYAGTRYLIVSLWPVNDKTAPMIMSEFYKNLLSLHDVRDAFNKTIKNIKNGTNNWLPKDWGAFILIGN